MFKYTPENRGYFRSKSWFSEIRSRVIFINPRLNCFNQLVVEFDVKVLLMFYYAFTFSCSFLKSWWLKLISLEMFLSVKNTVLFLRQLMLWIME